MTPRYRCFDRSMSLDSLLHSRGVPADWSAAAAGNPCRIQTEGKTLGILGLGRTGTAVAKCSPAFGLRVIAWGPTLTPERAGASGAKMVGEQELFRTADIFSVHLRRSEMSHQFVNATRLALMKPSALLIDISWAGIVDRKRSASSTQVISPVPPSLR
jgi:phosphoglycerate dehydrogenase-like enzyme